MKFQLLTLATLASTTLAVNLEQVRLINDDELIIQDAQFGYPAIVNLKDGDAEIEKKKTTTSTAKKDKKTSTTEFSVTSTTHAKVTSTKHKSSSITSTKKHDVSSTSTKHNSTLISVTKTGAGETATFAVCAPVVAALALLL
ncbi:hypothetical protein G210_1163 [Candida maltosa Xu316]|uniref:Uncharacterized protein n=1 Tax=Candida maltosa (strain Xu316) TaxID=1245528 RepID=M3J857_CANMX|nr:hypothetical protein G210_1163 [Candida maltosa Xu316]